MAFINFKLHEGLFNAAVLGHRTLACPICGDKKCRPDQWVCPRHRDQAVRTKEMVFAQRACDPDNETISAVMKAACEAYAVWEPRWMAIGHKLLPECATLRGITTAQAVWSDALKNFASKDRSILISCIDEFAKAVRMANAAQLTMLQQLAREAVSQLDDVLSPSASSRFEKETGTLTASARESLAVANDSYAGALTAKELHEKVLGFRSALDKACHTHKILVDGYERWHAERADAYWETWQGGPQTEESLDSPQEDGQPSSSPEVEPDDGDGKTDETSIGWVNSGPPETYAYLVEGDNGRGGNGEIGAVATVSEDAAILMAEIAAQG